MEESGVVVSFVEVFEDRGENFRFSDGTVRLDVPSHSGEKSTYSSGSSTLFDALS